MVPAGNNWTVPPFSLTEKDGRLWGRGIADDKGAALVTLYCLRALNELGVKGRNTLRAIYGTAEETGMTDMDGYFAQRRLPDLAFTPDSEYGICYAEKGILHLEVSTPTNEAKVLSQFHAGKAINAVPDLAYAMLDSSGYDEQLLMRLADAGEGSFEFNYTIDGLMIVSRGKAAHACEPQKGFNAASALIDLAVNCETNGRSLGLKMSDSVSGALTVNLGAVHIEGSEARALFDIRYPVTVNGDFVLRQFRTVSTTTARFMSRRTASWFVCSRTPTKRSWERSRSSTPQAEAPTPASCAAAASPSDQTSRVMISACTTPTRALTGRTSCGTCRSALRRCTDYIHWSKL